MDHELRRILAGEAHARPTVPVSAPAMVLHEAFFHEDDGSASRAFAEAFAARIGQAPPRRDVDHLLAETPEGTWKWERHGEFSTWTFVHPGAIDAAVAIDAPTFLADAPGRRFAAAALFVGTETPGESELDRVLGPESAGNERAGSLISGGLAGVWTSFRMGEDGWTRLRFANLGMGRFRAGRVVRRLLEIEVYRIAALFAFPMANAAKRRIDRLEKQVGDAIANETKPDAEVLDALIDAAREVERIAQDTTFRFGAANAYRRLVDQRLAELREDRIEGVQRLSTFLARRFAPAMDTCASTQTRLETLAKRVERAAGLLRTKVDLALAAQNQLQLESMNQNAKAQLRLQRAVEGFSVAAISYYAYSLLAEALAPLARSLGATGAGIANTMLVIATVATVGIVLARLRRRL
jgi:uncharacterized membrane-anchored protein